MSDQMFMSKSIQYGISNESNAKQLYQNMYNVEVKQVGLIISHLQPWMCASLDGVVVQNGIIIKNCGI